MNRRQRKKYWRNHVTLVDTVTGKQSIVKLQTLMKLVEIAKLTPEEFKDWIIRIGDAEGGA